MIFSEFARKYFELGYAVIPIKKQMKRPELENWSQFSERLPTDDEIDDWIEKYPDHNIGIVCGKASNVEFFDFDSEDPFYVEKVPLIIPPSPVSKAGKKGFTRAYKYSGIPNRTFKGVADFLSDGRQTVIPPSIHPETRLPYVYLTRDTLLTIDKDDLPLVDWNPIFNQIEKIVKHTEATGTKVEGRNNTLKSLVAIMISEGSSLERIVNQVFIKDLSEHPTNPLFSDKSEWRQTDNPLWNTWEFVLSNFRSINHKRMREKKSIQLPVSSEESISINTDFETKEDGFFFRIQHKDSTITWKPDHYGFAEWLKKKYNFINTNASDYIYEDNYYRPISEAHLSRIITDETLGKVHPVQIDGFKKIAKARNFLERFHEEMPGLINLKDGVLDVKTGELLSHNPKYKFQYCLPHQYDPKARCPKFIEFLEFVLMGDQELIKIIQQFMGYAIEGGKPWLHKGLCAYGNGRNGKSTLLEVFKAMLGKDNFTSVSLSRIGMPFSAVMLDGKLANILEESPSSKIDSEILKNCISGGNITASHKGKPEYVFPCQARFIFATNELPFLQDTTAGANERLLFVPFNRYIEEEERDPDLIDSLLGEMPGIINFALSGLKELKTSKFIAISKASKDVSTEYRKETDSVFRFFHERMHYIENSGKFVSSRDAYDKYVYFCAQCKSNVVKDTTFYKRLSKCVEEFTRATRLDLSAIRVDRPHRGYNNFDIDNMHL